MVDVIVKAKLPGEKTWAAYGLRSFAVLPRIGEIVGIDIDGKSHAFRVVDVHHPIEPIGTLGTAGDLYLSQVGTLSEEIKDLFERS